MSKIRKIAKSDVFYENLGLKFYIKSDRFCKNLKFADITDKDAAKTTLGNCTIKSMANFHKILPKLPIKLDMILFKQQ